MKKLLKRLRNKTNAFKAQKELTEHYKELFHTGVGELRAERLKSNCQSSPVSCPNNSTK